MNGVVKQLATYGLSPRDSKARRDLEYAYEQVEQRLRTVGVSVTRLLAMLDSDDKRDGCLGVAGEIVRLGGDGVDLVGQLAILVEEASRLVTLAEYATVREEVSA